MRTFTHIALLKLNAINLCFFLSLYAANVNSQPGSLDLTFGNGGLVVTKIGSEYDGISSIALQNDLKIVAGGHASDSGNYNFAVTLYYPNGNIDTSFGENGIVTIEFDTENDVGRSLVVQADNKILISGYANKGSIYDFAITRLNDNGSIDSTFGIDGKVITTFGCFAVINSSVLGNDGKLVVAGGVGDLPISPANHDIAVCRYNIDGSLDTTFGVNGIVITSLYNDDIAMAVKILNNGNIIVAGHTYIGLNRAYLVIRYLPNGSLDTSFGNEGKVITQIGTDGCPFSLEIQPDEKIVLAGMSTTESESFFTLVRYNSNGSLDSSFGEGGIVRTALESNKNFGRSILVQQDQKIVVGGNTKSFNTHTDIVLIRYNSDGSIDSTFGINGFVIANYNNENSFAASIISQEGKILVGGSAFPSNTQSSFLLMRYNSETNPGIANNTDEGPSVIVYPNPTSNEITIQRMNNNKGLNCDVYDIRGKWRKAFAIEPNKQKHIFDASSLENGLYFLFVKDSDSKYNLFKIVIER